MLIFSVDCINCCSCCVQSRRTKLLFRNYWKVAVLHVENVASHSKQYRTFRQPKR